MGASDSADSKLKGTGCVKEPDCAKKEKRSDYSMDECSKETAAPKAQGPPGLPRRKAPSKKSTGCPKPGSSCPWKN